MSIILRVPNQWTNIQRQEANPRHQTQQGQPVPNQRWECTPVKEEAHGDTRNPVFSKEAHPRTETSVVGE